MWRLIAIAHETAYEAVPGSNSASLTMLLERFRIIVLCCKMSGQERKSLPEAKIKINTTPTIVSILISYWSGKQSLRPMETKIP